MPIQDDIDDANLSRIEREAQRQKRAAQRAPTVQYMGTDGATGQVRVISGSGAASVRVANHSNTQPRPGDIKRGFAGGFDRGNVRRAVGIIPPRKPKETGNTRVLYMRQSDRQLYVGGHVEEPLPTGIILPASMSNPQYFIEDVGEGDNDHIVSYSYYNAQNVRTIGSYNGKTGNKWQIQDADSRLNYRKYGIFSTDIIALPFSNVLIPGTNNTTITETVDISTGGILYPTYLQTGNETSGITTRRFTGSGQYRGSIPSGITISTHSYYQQNIFSSCIIPYGSQSKNEIVRDSSHASNTLCLRVNSGNIERIEGFQSYSEKINQTSGGSESGGQPGDAVKYDDSFSGSIDNSTTFVAQLPIAVGVSGILQGERSYNTSTVTPAYSWQHLISIPAPYGSAVGVDPNYYQAPPDGFPPTTTIINEFTETLYSAENNIKNGYYYTKTNRQGSNFIVNIFLNDGREVNSRLYNSELQSINGAEYRYSFDSGEASFFPLTTTNGKLDYENSRSFKAELKIINAPFGYGSVGVFVPVYQKLDVIPA